MVFATRATERYRKEEDQEKGEEDEELRRKKAPEGLPVHLVGWQSDHISAALLSNGCSEFCCESPSSALSSKCSVLEQIIFVPYIRLLI